MIHAEDLCTVLAICCLGLGLLCGVFACAWWQAERELREQREEAVERFVAERKRESVRRWLSRN